MTRAVEGFTGLEHALEPVAEIGGVRFVNDSKATNIEAARRAIESFDAGLVVILGGRFKGGDFARSARRRWRRAQATVVAIGEAAPLIARGARRRRCRCTTRADMASAVRTAFASARARRHGAARAGVRELRHVPRLRGARPGVQAAKCATAGEDGGGADTREQ